jgi:predicted MFS family arabinose efflux permease
MEPTTVGFVFTVMMVGSIVGPLLGGRLADRWHPQKVLLGAFTLAALMTISFPWVSVNVFSTSAAALVLGVSAFGTHPILQSMVVQVTDKRTRDMGFAWFYTATFMAGAIWSPAVGYVAELLGLQAVFAAMAASFIAASACIMIGRLGDIPQAQQSYSESLPHG